MKKKREIFSPPGNWVSCFLDRARKLVRLSDVSLRELAAKSGLNSASAVSQFLNGQRESVNVAILQALLDLADMNSVSRAWLLCVADDAEAARHSPVQAGALLAELREELGPRLMEIVEPILKTHGVVSPLRAGDARASGGMSVLAFQKQAVPAKGRTQRSAIEIVDVEQLPPDWPGRYVPIIGRLAAGIGIGTDEAEAYPAGVAYRYLAYAGAPKMAFALEVAGDSMSPDYHHGDIVIVDPSKRAEDGVCAVIVRADGERTARIKRLVVRRGAAELQSINPEYSTIKVPLDRVEAFAIWKHLSA